MKVFIIGTIIGAILSTLAIFFFVDPVSQPTYLEPNPVENFIWLQAAQNDFPFYETYGSDLANVCVFGNVDTSTNTLLAMNDLRVKSVFRGSLEEGEQEQLGGLFRVVLINEIGQAEIWKFDERRFQVSFEDRNEKFGCASAQSVSYRIDQAAKGKFILEIKAMERG